MSEEQTNATLPQLSERELEILRLVASGLSNKEIAAQLVLSPNTVKVHLRNIFGKIGVQSRTEATMVAVRQGWVNVSAEAHAAPVTEEPDAGAESEAEVETGPVVEVKPPLTRPRIVEPPLPWLQRIALVVVLALVIGGLGLTWPRAEMAGGSSARNEFSDLPGDNVPALVANDDSRWQPGAQMPTQRGRLALATWKTRLYAIGGITPGGVTGVVEVFDVLKNAWSSGASKPTPVSNISAAVLNDMLIVPGGSTSNGAPTSVVEVYDPATDAWSPVASLPAPLAAYALAVYGGQVYVFGGSDGHGYVGQVLSYDPAADRWTAHTSMPTPRGFAAAATLDKAIYVVGGYDGRREFATCERYWPERDTWEACAPLTVGRGGLGLASIVGRLYAVGGGWSGYLAFGERYDPAANAWSPVETPLAGEWRNLAVTTFRTDLYAVGGWNGQAYSAVLEKYNPFPFQLFFPSP